MTDYALTTWAGDRLIGYEPIIAKSAPEATAFAQGMLTERVRHHVKDLDNKNLRYDVEHGSRALHEVPSEHVAVVIGSWTLDATTSGTPLIPTLSKPEPVETT